MKYNTGNWVEVTVRREGAPESAFRGKIIEATPDYAVAECRTPSGLMRFTMSDDTFGHIWFRRLQGSDFRRRR